METVYYVGDKVLNLIPHYDEDRKLVPLNAVGHVDKIEDGSLTIIWNIDEYPYHTTTKCLTSSVVPA